MKALVKLPIGIEFFQEIRTEGFYYVEKTGLSAELLNAWNDHHIKIRHCLPQTDLHGQNGGRQRRIKRWQRPAFFSIHTVSSFRPGTGTSLLPPESPPPR